MKLSEINSSLCGVLLLSHGGPDSPADIEPFLRNIRGGRGFSQELLREITDRYRQIGGRSPLLEISRRQARALENELNATQELTPAHRFRVYLGMRNWRPLIGEAMEEIKRDQVDHLIALCLAPQNSRLSVGLYFQHVQEARKKSGVEGPVSFVESWHQEPLLIEAFAEKLREATASFPQSEAGAPSVIFTAHSLPEKIMSEGDPYDRETRETAAAVALRCGLANWRFAYQSQGATADAWMGPTVESVVEELSASGCRQIVVAPIGFLADHLEILYDVDVAFRKFARERGMELRRTQSLNDSPKLAQAMAAVVHRQLAREKATSEPLDRQHARDIATA